MVRDGICGELKNRWHFSTLDYFLVGPEGQKWSESDRQTHFILFICPILAPTPNFIKIGWKTKFKISAIGQFTLLDLEIWFQK